MHWGRRSFSLVFRVSLGAAFFLFLGFFGGCGKSPSYQLGSQQVQLQGPGSYSAPVPVDIVLALDDSPSLRVPLGAEISQWVQNFLKQLEQKDWDYRLVLVSLTQPDWKPETWVGSVYDANHPRWVPALPGLTRSEALTEAIPAPFFRTASSFEFKMPLNNGSEEGFKILWKHLHSLEDLGFFRSDSLRVVMILSNGDDLSDLKMQTPQGGWDPQEWKATFNDYYEKFKTWSASRPTDWVAWVAFQDGPCRLGKAESRAFEGKRYRALVKKLGGSSQSLCQNSVPFLFDQLTDHLQTRKKSFQQRYIPLDLKDWDEDRITRWKILLKRAEAPPPTPLERCAKPPAEEQSPCWQFQGRQKVSLIQSPFPLQEVDQPVLELSPPAFLKAGDSVQLELF